MPEAIGQLSKLQKLYLFNNQLSTLPEAMGQLSKLQELYLSGNQLSALPDALQGLVRLKLFLHGDPGLGLPDEVLGPTIEEFLGSQRRRSPKPSREILDYYFATRGAKGRARLPATVSRLAERRKSMVAPVSPRLRCAYVLFSAGNAEDRTVRFAEFSGIDHVFYFGKPVGTAGVDLICRGKNRRK